MEADVLEKCLWVWYAGPFQNACVVLRAGEKPGTVVLGDLDAGDEWVVRTSSLRKKCRLAEQADFGYSWTANHDERIFDAVLEREETRYVIACRRAADRIARGTTQWWIGRNGVSWTSRLAEARVFVAADDARRELKKAERWAPEGQKVRVEVR